MNVQIMNDEAVSPVIGVILMVAITVILAATIAIFVFGETDKLDNSQKMVALQGSATSDQIMMEISGGSDIAELEKLTFLFKTDAGEKYPEYIIANRILLKDSSAEGYDGNTGILLPSAENGTSAFPSNGFGSGDSFIVPNLGGDFKVIGIFADGTEQALYTKSFAMKGT